MNRRVGPRIAVLILVAAFIAMPLPFAAADESQCGGTVTPDTNGERRGTPGNDVLIGTAGDDVFIGLAGDDVICGFGGTDTLYHYDVDAAAAPPVGKFAVSVDLVAHTSLIDRDGDGTAEETDYVYSIENVEGSENADLLLADDGANHLDGRAGNDELGGRGGNDKVDGGLGGDVAAGGGGNDSISGHVGNDSLSGGEGNDRLEGLEHDDTLAGGAGFDFVDYACTASTSFCTGMKGDSADYSGQAVNLATGNASPVGSTALHHHGSDSIAAVEGVRGTSRNDILTGRDNHAEPDPDGGFYGDYFWPGHGDDIVDGRAGPDYVDYTLFADDPNEDCTAPAVGSDGLVMTLVAGSGPEVTGYQGSDDLVDIEHAIGSARVDQITGSAGSNELWGGCSDDTISGGAGGDYLSGDGGNDAVAGGGGNDRLVDGTGNDAMYGNDGEDLVSYDAAPGSVDVHLGAGTAQTGGDEDAIGTVEAVLGGEFDDLLVGGSRRDLLIGGAGADKLWGRDGHDILLGNGVAPRPDEPAADGADQLYGGSGTDTADYSQATGGVTVNLPAMTATEGIFLDTVSGIEAVQGSAVGDRLVGDAADNLLFGGKGNDFITGDRGNDYLDGEGGIDRVNGEQGPLDVVDFGYGTADRVEVDLVSEQATVFTDGMARTDTLVRADVVGGTSGDDALTGSDRADRIFGAAGADTLVGRGGDDSLAGSSGTDTAAGGTGSDECAAETRTSCETVREGSPAWTSRITDVRTFRRSGELVLLDDLGTVVDDLRRLHRRRLHR